MNKHIVYQMNKYIFFINGLVIVVGLFVVNDYKFESHIRFQVKLVASTLLVQYDLLLMRNLQTRMDEHSS